MAVEKMHLVNIMARLDNLDDFLEDLGLESCIVSSFFFTQITLKNIFMFFL